MNINVIDISARNAVHYPFVIIIKEVLFARNVRDRKSVFTIIINLHAENVRALKFVSMIK